MPAGLAGAREAPLLEDLTAAQREAVCHDGGPLLIIAGAGTGKTTVITRRIAWLIATKRARPEEILALTFTEKAAAEMEERVDLLVPYGYVDMTVSTFHAFGDGLLRQYAVRAGLPPHARVCSKGEQAALLRRHLFDLPLKRFRPAHDPARYVEALAAVFGRAKDEAVRPAEFTAYAAEQRRAAEASPDDAALAAEADRAEELAAAYAGYQRLLQEARVIDFGDQVLQAVTLLERHPDVLAAVRGRYRYILVDEFQDTNYAQFRLLELLAPEGSPVTVVADDDQSIYKWRGAAISNVLKFIEREPQVHTVVLTENFRSSQPILDAAYRLIRFNDPDRLEVRRQVNKRLTAVNRPHGEPPHVKVFDTASSEADWVARTIREAVDAGTQRPGDFAILVRSNREADLFLRALNVAGVPWSFSGASGLFAREESKLLLACLRLLAGPDDTLSWYHVAASPLYAMPMPDLMAALAHARKTHRSLREVLTAALAPPSEPLADVVSLSEAGATRAAELLADAARLQELSRSYSSGQLLYQWLNDRGFLRQALTEEAEGRLRTVARFFDQLRRLEELLGGSLADVLQHLALFEAMGNEAPDPDDAWADQVRVLTIHKAKGLEFPVVFMVGLVHGRFPTAQRTDPIELPEALIRDILPEGNYHLQEERRLFYVGMTRAKDTLYLTCAYDYGGKSVRKISQFAVEALQLASPSPGAKPAGAREVLERSRPPKPVARGRRAAPSGPLRLNPHGADDFLTCPLKYRYSHVLRLPVMRHHLVVYGTAVHKAVEAFFQARLDGREMAEAELLEIFDRHWIAEGFLTRTHEDARYAQGRETLRRFFAAQQARPEQPAMIEQKFSFPLDDILVVGRWDRVDMEGDLAVIIDYKTSEVTDQASADRKTRESFQLLVYALAWQTIHGILPARVELRFLESDLIGRSVCDEDDLEKARAALRQAAAGIRTGRFPAKPQEHACRWCAFQAICPSAFHAR